MPAQPKVKQAITTKHLKNAGKSDDLASKPAERKRQRKSLDIYQSGGEET
jgi:hypothetical protein